MDLHKWIRENKETTTKLFSLVILLAGILLIIGAIKNWDWIYKADEHYQSKWSLGQASRYLGRSTARVIGFAMGILITIIGAYWSYYTWYNK